MALFDIIIPSYNNRKELVACLEAFSQQSLKDFRVFICIDGSTDGSVESINHLDLKFDYLLLEHPDKCNHGRNATRNLAFSYLTANFVLFLDSDITPYPDLIEKHYQLLSSQTCISVGNVDYLNKNEDLWAGYISSRGYNKFKPLQEMAPEYMNMGNLAMPMIFFKSLDGMDANLKKYGGDDSELAIRLEKKFSPIVINNSFAKGFSKLNKSLVFALSQLEEFGEFNLKYIHRKHPGFGHIYAFNIMSGNNLKSITFRLMMSKFIADALLKRIILLPPFLKFKAIHYLCAYYLHKGFTKQLQE